MQPVIRDAMRSQEAGSKLAKAETLGVTVIDEAGLESLIARLQAPLGDEGHSDTP